MIFWLVGIEIGRREDRGGDDEKEESQQHKQKGGGEEGVGKRKILCTGLDHCLLVDASCHFSREA